MIAAALLAGCAGVTDTVIPAGQDTFLVATHGVMGWSSGPAQKARALERANAHCANIGKSFEVIRSSETPGGFGRIASAEIEFRCSVR